IADRHVPEVEAGWICIQRSSGDRQAGEWNREIGVRGVAYDRKIAAGRSSRLRCELHAEVDFLTSRYGHGQAQTGYAETGPADRGLCNGDIGTTRVGQNFRQALVVPDHHIAKIKARGIWRKRTWRQTSARDRQIQGGICAIADESHIPVYGAWRLGGEGDGEI